MNKPNSFLLYTVSYAHGIATCAWIAGYSVGWPLLTGMAVAIVVFRSSVLPKATRRRMFFWAYQQYLRFSVWLDIKTMSEYQKSGRKDEFKEDFDKRYWNAYNSTLRIAECEAYRKFYRENPNA